ncbi:MAG: antibiotic biosynthesis monooxygenase [Clostridia bacterium]|nr:antibiotic biosynthesis monooxygenase [Clostridia bacterium]
MAVLINIYYTGEKDHARRFAAEMTASGIVEEIRAEKGNLKYEYFFPMEDESTVLLIDHWMDQAALDAHHASPVMQKILALREKYELHMRV